MQINSPNLFVEINKYEFSFIVADNTESSDIEIVYKTSVPIEGIIDNKISDFDLVFNVIKKNIYSIEQKLNFTFKEIILVLDNFEFTILNLSGYKKLNGSQLLKENITYLLNSLKSKINDIEKDKFIIHIFNPKCILDKKETKNLPIGLFGNFYSHELCFYMININDNKNLINIFNNCNLKIKKTISKNFIKGANLINDNLNLDTFLIVEIGYKDSQIIFFQNSSLKFVQEFKFGSDLVINDISKVIGLKIDNIKNILNNSDFSESDLNNKYVEEKFFLKNNYRKIKKKLLFNIAKARIEEFSEIILFRNINIRNILSKKIPIFLNLKDKIDNDRLIENYKLIFSQNSKYEIKFLKNFSTDKLYMDANKIVQYGWRKEAVPIVQDKKSLIARFFDLFFN